MTNQESQAEDSVLETVGLKQAEFISSYVAEAGERAALEGLSGVEKQKAVLDGLADAYKRASDWSIEFSQRADIAGMEGASEIPAYLDKIAIEQRQISEYLASRTVEELSNLAGDASEFASGTIGKFVGEAGGGLLDAG